MDAACASCWPGCSRRASTRSPGTCATTSASPRPWASTSLASRSRGTCSPSVSLGSNDAPGLGLGSNLITERWIMISRLRVTLFVTALLTLARAASAQWTRVPQVPAVFLYSVSANGDTLLATADSTVFVSTDAGASWRNSTKVTTGGLQVQRAKIKNGRIYAGTRRKGVFVSADLGVTWSDFSQGLAGDTQLAIIDMLIQGDSIYVATEGAGAWVRNL